MSNTETRRYSVERLLTSRVFRHAHYYAPDSVMDALDDVICATDVSLLVDVDMLERSAFARIDGVMMLAFDALAHAGVRIVLVTRGPRERVGLLQRRIVGARCACPDDDPITSARAERAGVQVIVLSDSVQMLAGLTARDRGVVLGRPELARANVVSTGDTAVRAMLWWMLEERRRGLAV
jgi:hypothetical protein